MSRAEQAKIRHKVESILAKIKRGSVTKAATASVSVVRATIGRSTIEAYIFGAVTIILGVFHMTPWLKFIFLLVLCAISIDICWRSSGTAHWPRWQKLMLSLIAVSAIVAVSWHTFYIDWLMQHSTPLNLSADLSGYRYEPGSKVYGIQWRSDYSEIRLTLDNPQHRFSVEHLDLFVELDGNAIDMRVISQRQPGDIWIRSAPTLGDKSGRIEFDPSSIILGTDKGTVIQVSPEAVLTNRYHIISSGRLYREDKLNFIIVGTSSMEMHYPSIVSASGSYELVDGDTRVQKEIEWSSSIAAK